MLKTAGFCQEQMSAPRPCKAASLAYYQAPSAPAGTGLFGSSALVQQGAGASAHTLLLLPLVRELCMFAVVGSIPVFLQVYNEERAL